MVLVTGFAHTHYSFSSTQVSVIIWKWYILDKIENYVGDSNPNQRTENRKTAKGHSILIGSSTQLENPASRACFSWPLYKNVYLFRERGGHTKLQNISII